MKFQILVISGLLLSVACFNANAHMTKVCDEPAVQEVCDCPCLPMPTPCLEKCATQCSVEEKAPAHCFKVEKVQKTTDLYKIPSHSHRCCTITDENGTRPCGCGEGICCKKECPKKCEPKCCKPRCEKKCCPAKCEKKCHKCKTHHHDKIDEVK